MKSASTKSSKAGKAAPKSAKGTPAPKRAAGKRTAKEPKVATAAELLKALKPVKLEARVDAPTPVKGKAKAAARKPQHGSVAFRKDSPLPLEQNADRLLRKLRDEEKEFHPSQGKGTFDENKFDEFFQAEIETEVTRPAEIVHDRIARWRCQCCDAVIPVPRRTTVYHGEYVLEHDDVLGLLVNGERWVPKAETPLEVVQPGRLRDPWTGQTLKAGKHSNF